MAKKIKPIHPGKILLEEFLIPLNISQYRLAMNIGVAPHRINEIVYGLRTISANTALRLGKYFNISPQFWLNLRALINCFERLELISCPDAGFAGSGFRLFAQSETKRRKRRDLAYI